MRTHTSNRKITKFYNRFYLLLFILHLFHHTFTILRPRFTSISYTPHSFTDKSATFSSILALRNIGKHSLLRKINCTFAENYKTNNREYVPTHISISKGIGIYPLSGFICYIRYDVLSALLRGALPQSDCAQKPYRIVPREEP